MRLGAVFGESRTALVAALIGGGVVVAGALGVSLMRETPSGPTATVQPETETSATPDEGADSAEAGGPDEDVAPPATDGQDTASETVDDAAPPPLDPPGFDQIRVAPDGGTVIAGTAPPGATVVILLDGAELGRASANAAGAFAAILSVAPADVPRMLSLRADMADGQMAEGAETVIIAPFAAPERAPGVAVTEVEDSAPGVETADAAATPGIDVAQAETTPPEPLVPQMRDASGSDGAEEMAALAPDATRPPAPDAPDAPDAPNPVTAPATEDGAPATGDAAEVGSEAATGADGIAPTVQDTTAGDDAPTVTATTAEADAAPDAGTAAPPEAPAGADTSPETEAPAVAAAAPEVADAPETSVSGSAPVADNPDLPDLAAPEIASPDLADTALATPDIGPAAPVAPEGPALIIAGEDGVRVQRDTQQPDAQTDVRIDAIAYSTEGDVTLSGSGRPDRQVRISLNNEVIEMGEIGPDGQWSMELPGVDPGTYTLNVAQIAPDGSIETQVDTPFLREDPARLARNPMLVESGVGVITVQPGFTLWGIAEANFGEGLAYVQIFQQNREQIRDPDLIFPGQIFNLPDMPRDEAAP